MFGTLTERHFGNCEFSGFALQMWCMHLTNFHTMSLGLSFILFPEI